MDILPAPDSLAAAEAKVQYMICQGTDNKEGTASGKQMKQPITAVTSRDSDDEIQEVDQPMGQLLPTAPVTNGDSPIDVDMYTCKQPPAPYWIQDLELRQQDKAQLTEGAWLTDILTHPTSC